MGLGTPGSIEIEESEELMLEVSNKSLTFIKDLPWVYQAIVFTLRSLS
jgi:hypothetical protein